MPNQQQIQQCIQQCTQTANQLRAAANTLPDNRSREMATFGATHIEMCIHACENAVKRAQTVGSF